MNSIHMMAAFAIDGRSGLITVEPDGSVLIEHQDQHGRRGPPIRVLAPLKGAHRAEVHETLRIVAAGCSAAVHQLEWAW